MASFDGYLNGVSIQDLEEEGGLEMVEVIVKNDYLVLS